MVQEISEHDWAIKKVVEILRNRELLPWEIMEVNLGLEHGPDLVVKSQDGKVIIFESEVGAPSNRKKHHAKARMIKKYEDEKGVYAIIVIGREKHSKMLGDELKKINSKVKIYTLSVPKLDDGFLPI